MTVGEIMDIVEKIADLVEKCALETPLSRPDLDLIAEYLDNYSEELVNKKVR